MCLTIRQRRTFSQMIINEEEYIFHKKWTGRQLYQKMDKALLDNQFLKRTDPKTQLDTVILSIKLVQNWKRAGLIMGQAALNLEN